MSEKLKKQLSMIKNYGSSIYYYIILFFLVLFHLVNNYIWLKIDNSILIFDSHKYFMTSLYIFDGFKNFPLGLFSNIAKITVEIIHPSIFVPTITSLFYAIFGINQDIAVISSVLIFLPILVFSVYGLGKKIDSRSTGLLSAFLVTIYPAIFNQMRVYMLDLPLISMMTLFVYLLLRSERFASLKYSISAGFIFGLALLIKESFIIFISCPLLIILFRFFSDYINNYKKNKLRTQEIYKKQQFKKFRNFILFLLIGILIPLPIYII
jgi:4-amino-4-deoxy-L-arabinose transferase-like glycosyltransferase